MSLDDMVCVSLLSATLAPEISTVSMPPVVGELSNVSVLVGSDVSYGYLIMTNCVDGQSIVEDAAIVCVLQRINGTFGDVALSWYVRSTPGSSFGPEDLASAAQGTTVLYSRAATGVIEIQTAQDDLPEFNEMFQLVLCKQQSNVKL